MNSTSNIHRRYNLLFTLPSTQTVIALLLIISSPLILFASFISGLQAVSMLLSYLAFEAALFLSVILEHVTLKRNRIATFRRLIFVSVVTSSLWLVVVLLGTFISPGKFLSFIVVGAFFSAMLRLLVFGAVFFRSPYHAIPLATLQPLLLAMILTSGSNVSEYLSGHSLLLVGGVLLLDAVLLYLSRVNRSISGLLPVPTLMIFQAFLQAWSVEEAAPLESILEKSSSKTTVKTSVITFHSDGVNPMVVVPEIHPGPFYPIGSSNLPYRIHYHFAQQGFVSLILHGVSGHELNLVSKNEVNNLLSSYEHLDMLGEGATCSTPITVTSNRAVVNGLAFGDYPFLFLTLSPHGMEDFPREIKKPLEETSSANGFKHLFLVDTHNSQGEEIGQDEAAEAVDAAEKTLKNLRKSVQHPFRTGFAHSSEMKENELAGDIGPAGIGVLILEIDEVKYTLLAIDANNARRGLREEIISRLQELKISVLEICTSDTHINAGKVPTRQGYIALGDKTSADTLVDVTQKLYDIAVERLFESRFDVKSVETDVKTIGARLLDDVSQALDQVTGTARRGGISLISLSLLLFLSSLIL
jgi:putative membrane protein